MIGRNPSPNTHLATWNTSLIIVTFVLILYSTLCYITTPANADLDIVLISNDCNLSNIVPGCIVDANDSVNHVRYTTPVYRNPSTVVTSLHTCSEEAESNNFQESTVSWNRDSTPLTHTTTEPAKFTHSTPQNKVSLSTDDISQCVVANLNLNRTAVDEIWISFIQHERYRKSPETVITNVSSNTNISGLSPPENRRGFAPAGDYPRHSDRHSPTDSGRGVPPESSHRSSRSDTEQSPRSASLIGRCTISMEAPPGKLLSVLFLNQTCSRYNRVRVHDAAAIHNDGGSATLWDGCSPWKSPGYDVTTSGRSARMVVELHDLVGFYRLRVHIAAVAEASRKRAISTRYVSSVLGYIQSQGWHPYSKSTFYRNIHEIAAVGIPSDHVAMISAVFIYIHNQIYSGKPTNAKLHKLVLGSRTSETVWSTCHVNPPDVVLLRNVTEFQLEFRGEVGVVFTGVRLLFSFHQLLLAPQRRPEGLWNCSMSFWPDFRLHLVCNNLTECSVLEDEMWCPDSTCLQGGGLQLDDSCYFFRLLPSRMSTWNHAQHACLIEGATLASFPTVSRWYHFALIKQSQLFNLSGFLFFGIRSSDHSLRHMYQYLAQWEEEGSIAYFSSFMRQERNKRYCGYFTNHSRYPRIPLINSCADRAGKGTVALCRKNSTSEIARDAEDTISIQESRQPIDARLNPGLETPNSTISRSKSTSSIWKQSPLFVTVCPDQHRTHDFLACDATSACRLSSDGSAGNDDFDDYGRGVDLAESRRSCSDVGNGPDFKALFTCNRGASLVPYSLVCDHCQDCEDNDDEDFCVFTPCHEFECANGQCLPFSAWCDYITQCLDESDEEDCQLKIALAWEVTTPLPVIQAVDFDGYGSVVFTSLPTDGNSDSLCPDTHVFCPDIGDCLPVYIRCNGVNDCPGLKDEAGCDSNICPSLYRCRGYLNTCLHPEHLCDGWPQCLQHDDERFCNLTCPLNCTCLGHAFTCGYDFRVESFSDLRYLDAGGSGLEPRRLENNPLIVYLSLSNCHLERLGYLKLLNLRSFELSDNRLSYVTAAELLGLSNLQNLSLSGNPLSAGFKGNYSSLFGTGGFSGLLHVDLTGTEIEELAVRSFLPFPTLLSLNLSKSGITRILGDGFRSMKSLTSVDLRGCPVTVVPKGVFRGLKYLRQVFADNFKLCCPAALPEGFNPDNCQAPFIEVSSCDALLRSVVYRVCLSVLAALALSGNLGSLCLRVFALAGSGKTGFNVFVTCLCVSDFVMGIYLVIIGVADRVYLGNYLWEDNRWRTGATCQVAGVLALFSSEVSAFIISLITLDRFLVIRFPFSRLRFSPFSAKVACLTVCLGGVALVAVPLLPTASHWQFYGATGICVPLPITRHVFAGQRYAFGVMILLNLVIFVGIAAGQVSVYLSMTRNAMSASDTSRRSRDLIVARRLITVVVSDFLCWFPIGLMGVLAAQGVAISGEVNVVLAIVVLPLNSALNPFLYTLNVIQEKQRRVKEARLLNLIMDRGVNDEESVDKK